MRPDVVTFHRQQLSFIKEKFYHISLPKPYNFSSVLLNNAVMTIRVQVHSQFVFTEADIQMFEMKITV